jgi:DNA-binding transcriptional ArsR family regulator
MPVTAPTNEPCPGGQPGTGPFQPRTRRPATDEEARALASGVRLRILRLCLDDALTNKEIAARLGANAATTLHHVRKLVATGFLAPQDERRGTRGAREVPYLATRKSWTLNVHHKVEGSGQAMIDAFLDEISHVDIDAGEADRGPGGLSRVGLRLSPADFTDLCMRMDTLLQEYAARPPDMEHGQPVSVFLALYPDVTRDAPAAALSADHEADAHEADAA